MPKPFFQTLLLAICITLAVACSKEDNETNACRPTNVTMKVNGELQSFQAMGRGIDMGGSGYTLSLVLDRREMDTFREQGVAISLPYKKTGDHVIEHFNYHQYINSTSFDGDFINGDFTSKVITNTRTCFYAEFSGKLSDGNQEVIITEGKLSYEYEEPFDN